ncbi:MAG: hypothetical protein ABIG20_00960 [archaeon]
MVYVEPSIVATMAQAIMILLIGWATREKFTYKGAIANGIMVLFAGGTLLYYTNVIGFFLLAYGAFIMVSAMEEYELHRLKKNMKPDWLAYVIYFLGNYIVAAAIIVIAGMYSYSVWPFV